MRFNRLRHCSFYSSSSKLEFTILSSLIRFWRLTEWTLLLNFLVFLIYYTCSSYLSISSFLTSIMRMISPCLKFPNAREPLTRSYATSGRIKSSSNRSWEVCSRILCSFGITTIRVICLSIGVKRRHTLWSNKKISMQTQSPINCRKLRCSKSPTSLIGSMRRPSYTQAEKIYCLYWEWYG